MHLPGFLVSILHILGIGKGDDSGKTTISTVDDYFSSKRTSPIVFDTTTFAKLHSTSFSPELITTLASTYSTENEIIERTSLTTGGITQEFQSSKSSAQPTVPKTTDTGNSTETGTTDKTTPGTTVTGKTEPPTTVTGKTEPHTTVTGKTEPHTTVTGKTEPHTTVTGKTEPDTTVMTTATDHPGTTKSTDAPPTSAPKLSRGAVAGIVIGCLLLVAVVAAAVVFFLKNRNIPPESQRLRV